MKTVGTRLLALSLALIFLLALVACGEEENGGDAYSISYNGAKICPGEKAGGLLDKLGTPKAEMPVASCGDQGEQIRYTYDSFYLYFLVASDGKQTVDAVEFRNDLIETSEGITIGSSKDAVQKAYGDPSETFGNTLTYKNGKQKLIIQLKDNRVAELKLAYVSQ
ncbi:MAG: hypothetical protein IKA76_09335 [Clostridia bacterium]|nr:hypothetical protein [Clostridia bacterium]